ncbi:MAG TPA: hypothetical protein VGQ71_02550 [Terriglobales bacterium]|nr:hypothetical protein [Terriglobales bacterium]
MRTTLTLEEDVLAKLKAEMRRTGASFKQVVNETLRRGLMLGGQQQRRKPFRVRARNLGLRPGLEYDSISQLLEQVEGPLHR